MKHITENEIEKEKRLTHGSSSELSIGHLKSNPTQQVVIKEMFIDINGCRVDGIKCCVEEYQLRVSEYIHEIYTITFPKHENIMQVLNYIEQPMILIMECFPHGNLYDYIEKYPSLTIEEIRGVAIQIANGIHFLHSNGYIHRDIKSPNVLIELTENNKIKRCAISDFGELIPKHLSSPINAVECPYWLAPEIIEGKEFTQASDVFSYGMIIWELVCWSHPFPNVTNLSTVRDMVLHYNMPDIPTSNYLFTQIIKHCWNPVDLRMNIATVKNYLEMSKPVMVLENYGMERNVISVNVNHASTLSSSQSGKSNQSGSSKKKK